jgi:pyroglutamyl-peptidase
MTRVLVTCFEPFGEHSANSSLEVARAVARRPPPGVELDWVVLPVVAGVCVERAWTRIRQTEPSLVLALGQAAGARALRIEGVAVNLSDFAITDNAGNRPQKQPIVSGGPTAYRATASAQAIRQALSYRDIPSELSRSAGTYVCNHLFYGLLHRAGVAGHRHQTGFIHLPLLSSQVSRRTGGASMNLEQLVESIRLAITACEPAETSEVFGDFGSLGTAPAGTRGLSSDWSDGMRQVGVNPQD